MPFDAVSQPIVAGGTLFLSSSADCQVRALDAATGRERWTFFTEGPVRFAPTVADGRAYVVSDDGFLYCIDGATGALVWKHRGGPMDSMVLGNGRMISRWPARGGPAVADGVVYWAAGIWPSEGIFLYAMDAATGKVLWCNDSSGAIYMAQPHPGAYAKSGVSAQGDLVVDGDRLLVPTGRAVPAVFNRRDGKLLYFHLGKNTKTGGAEVVAAGAHFFNGGSVFDSATGAAQASLRIPTRTTCVVPSKIILAKGQKLLAIDREQMLTYKEAVDRRGKPITVGALAAPVWETEITHSAEAMVVAGCSAVLAARDHLTVVDTALGHAKMSTKVEGTPLGLAVAGDRLYASTDKGVLYCFGPANAAEPAQIKPEPATSPYEPNGVFAAAAEEIVSRSGVTVGYCLDVGCGDGPLAYALVSRTKLHVIAIDPDPEKVAIARQRFDRAGLLGVRVTVLQGTPESRGLPNYFADLIVSARSVADGSGAVKPQEWNRHSRPCGGVACLGKPGAMRQTVRGALKGAGEWTHQYCDAANTNCSVDELARGPLGMLWFNDLNLPMPSRHGRGPAPLSRDGRMFVEGIDALRCVNAYNGRSIWEYPLPGILKVYDGEHIMGTSGTGSNLCMSDHGLYVRVEGKCLRLDPATGKLLAELEPPEPGTWGAVAGADDTLFGTLANSEHTVGFRYGPGDMSTQFTESRLLFALDAQTGECRWSLKPEHSIRHNSLAIGRGRVFLIDRPLALGDRLDRNAARRRGKPPEHPKGALVALRARTGKVAWQTDEGIYGTLLAVSEKHDVLLMSYQPTGFRLESEIGGRMAAFRASTGKRLWDVAAKYASRPIINGRTIYAQPGAWDLLTGKPLKFSFSRAYGCGTVSGSRHLMLYRSGTFGYTDLGHDLATENYGGLRPGCWINAIAAGGLVLMPDATDRCRCSYLIKASIALQPFGIRPPKISPNGASSNKPVTVRLTSPDKRASVRYTLDGRTPTRRSRKYSRPIRVSQTAELQARAFAPGAPPSQVSTAEFIIDRAIIAMSARGWEVQDGSDSARKSNWQVADGAATELSNITRGGTASTEPGAYRPGTMRVYTRGKKTTNGELTVSIASADNDVLGVAFRYQGLDRYYVWSMDEERSYHALACKDGDAYRLLAHNQKGYVRNRWYEVRVVLAGNHITVFVDGEKDLEATDDTLRKGTFALYAWGCTGAKFRNVKWRAKR